MDDASPEMMSLFAAALERPTAEARAAYLDAACGPDAELRARVEALLRAHAQAGGFLRESSETCDPEATLAPPAAAGPGTRVGPYQLLEPLGEGGMGTVWLAQQHQPVRRLVAVKLIRAGLGGAHALARFEAERQALALMDHPHIAKVHDAGATTDGRPFFVMELVQGVPITRYCDERRLTVRQRLELFAPVCQAVQHAHQKGVIHRDVKPSNVLVALYDERPVPKVIDFGVAKAAGPPLTEESLHTGLGAVVGTPEYMSPEQAGLNALDVDTRSDVYALGVLLYELLTGSPPFSRKQLERAGVLEMLRLIREQEPPRPSTKLSTAEGLPALAAKRGTEPARLAKLVRGELDWIVLKALEKDRDRRYETANALAADVQRYLADEPVQAGPPSRWYRLQKFVRRNRGPVLAAALVLLALVGGVVGTTWGLIRAEHARQGEEEQRLAAQASAERAVKAQAKAEEAVEHYLSAVTEDLDLKYKHDLHPLRKKLLGAAVPFYEWFTTQKPGQVLSEAKRGWAYGRLGNVRNAMGEKEAALKDSERTRAVFSRLAADFPTAPEHRRSLALCHYQLGDLLADLGQAPAAEQAYRRAIGIQEELAAGPLAVPQILAELAHSHNSLGILLRDLGRRPAAEKAYRRALAIREKLAAEFRKMPRYWLDLAHSHNNLANLLKDLGRRAAAEKAYRRAIEIKKQMVVEFADSPAYRKSLATGHHNLGILLHDFGQYPAAGEALRQALEIQGKLVADFPTMPLYRHELARSHASLGKLLSALGKWPAAEEALGRALEIQEKLVADFRKVPDYRLELAQTNNALAILLVDLGKKSAAEAFGRALKIRKGLVADFPKVPNYRRDLALSHQNLGALLIRLGQRPAAEKAIREAIKIGKELADEFRTVPNYQRDLAFSHKLLGILLRDLGQRLAAERALRRALEVQEKLARDFPRMPLYHQDLANTLEPLGLLLWDLGQRPAAGQAVRRALKIRKRLATDFRAVPLYRLELAGSSVNFGNLLQRQGEVEASLAWYARAIALLDALVKQEPRLATARRFLHNAHRSRASALSKLARHADAVKDWDRLLALNAVPADQPRLRSGRAESLARAGEHARAVAEASALAEAKGVTGGTLYDLARVCALAAHATKDDAPKQDGYAARAVELLRGAVARGFKNISRLNDNKDLEPLRSREDFKKLLAEVKRQLAK
jgi:eukaryotic-like serine/threonine-protein kinase